MVMTERLIGRNVGIREDPIAIAGSPLGLPLVAAAKLQPAGVLKARPLGRNGDALGRWHGIPQRIIAVRVVHVPLPEPAHGSPPLRCDDGVVLGGKEGVFLGACFSGWDLLDGVGRAAIQDQVFEFGDKRGIFVIHLVFPS